MCQPRKHLPGDEELKMEIISKKDGSKLTVTIIGDLTAQTVTELNTLIDEELEDVTDIVFKLDGLNYTSSAGLRAFLRTWKVMDKKGGTAVIEGITETVKSIFMVSGFDRFLEIRD